MPPTTSLTSPNGGEVWAAGSSRAITASITGTITGWQLDYSTNGGSTWTMIYGISTTNTSVNYLWTVPNSVSSTCKVRITVNYTGGSVTDASNANFSITDNTLPVVTALDVSSASIIQGGSVTISYSATDNVGLSKVELYRAPGGSTPPTTGWVLVKSNSASGTSTSSSFTDSPPLGTYWYGVTVYDTSNNKGEAPSSWLKKVIVSAAPTVTLTSPNGGESWAAGSSRTITASCSGTITGWQLDYSTNGGSTWTMINGISTTSLPSSYNWTVPSAPSSTCRVKLTLLYSGGSVSDTSNANFTIQSPPALRLARVHLMGQCCQPSR
ncbi:MAG: hypothetical protein HC888_02885 [Candidatus Competibacteraceae bacterium]|nr:hypothetical protein [Candidatus Competibacteraceae bacterium]